MGNVRPYSPLNITVNTNQAEIAYGNNKIKYMRSNIWGAINWFFGSACYIKHGSNTFYIKKSEVESFFTKKGVSPSKEEGIGHQLVTILSQDPHAQVQSNTIKNVGSEKPQPQTHNQLITYQTPPITAPSQQTTIPNQPKQPQKTPSVPKEQATQPHESVIPNQTIQTKPNQQRRISSEEAGRIIDEIKDFKVDQSVRRLESEMNFLKTAPSKEEAQEYTKIASSYVNPTINSYAQQLIYPKLDDTYSLDPDAIRIMQSNKKIFFTDSPGENALNGANYLRHLSNMLMTEQDNNSLNEALQCFIREPEENREVLIGLAHRILPQEGPSKNRVLGFLIKAHEEYALPDEALAYAQGIEKSDNIIYAPPSPSPEKIETMKNEKKVFAPSSIGRKAEDAAHFLIELTHAMRIHNTKELKKELVQCFKNESLENQEFIIGIATHPDLIQSNEERLQLIKLLIKEKKK